MSLCVGNPDFPDTGGWCCSGAAMFGADHCTCWEAVYDLDQAPLDVNAVRLLAAGVQPNTRDRMCGDCAYRPGSPERLGDQEHAGDPELLEELAACGEPFWCHGGMRRRAGWVHPPTGTRIAGHPADYDPPRVAGVPWRADGTPGELCAGWAARNRALAGGELR